MRNDNETINFDDINVGDELTITQSYYGNIMTITIVGTATTVLRDIATIKCGNRTFKFGKNEGDRNSLEIIRTKRAKTFAHKLADAYGEMDGLNRYQRFAKLVEDFGLDKA